METEELYELIHEAVSAALADANVGEDLEIHKRMLGGQVHFDDGQGRRVKSMPVEAVFKKVTGVREKLRVLEQKINNNKSLDAGDKAEFQTAITRCYGSLTTFNFLFGDDLDKFKGTGG